jgi:hypothetical protein
MSEQPLIYYPIRRPSIHYATQEPGEFNERHLAEIQTARRSATATG